MRDETVKKCRSGNQENKERIQKMKQEILLIQAEEKEEHRDETRLIRGTQVEYYLEDKGE